MRVSGSGKWFIVSTCYELLANSNFNVFQVLLRMGQLIINIGLLVTRPEAENPTVPIFQLVPRSHGQVAGLMTCVMLADSMESAKRSPLQSKTKLHDINYWIILILCVSK